MPDVAYRLDVDGHVVRYRVPAERRRPPKARWVIHNADCEHAGGCPPLADLVAEFTEVGVMVRLQRRLIARCKTCQPMLLRRE